MEQHILKHKYRCLTQIGNSNPVLKLHFANELKICKYEMEDTNECPYCYQTMTINESNIVIKNSKHNRRIEIRCKVCSKLAKRAKLSKRQKSKTPPLKSDAVKQSTESVSTPKRDSILQNVSTSKKKKKKKRDPNAGLIIPKEILEKKKNQVAQNPLGPSNAGLLKALQKASDNSRSPQNKLKSFLVSE